MLILLSLKIIYRCSDKLAQPVASLVPEARCEPERNRIGTGSSLAQFRIILFAEENK